VPRTLDPAAHALRRDEFVDVALRLIQAKGYEQLSIGDVLTELGASKGAFYHYFDSKATLLEAVVERITDTVVALASPMLDDPSLPAIEKLQLFFQITTRWKMERRDLLLGLLEVWQSDDNAIVREKVLRASVRRTVPIIARIVRQGMDEGEFAIAPPEQLAQVVVALVFGFGQANADLFLAYHGGEVDRPTVERTAATYSLALERILGVSPGSLSLMDAETLRAWFA
jgi:AcrR family transcriptional regulator